MGNVRSQRQQQQQSAGGSLCLLYLIQRSWRLVLQSGARAKGPDDTDDCATDLSTTASRCSGCKGCGYHQELNFDSESDMAPNAEEDLLVSMPRGPHSAKERLRPPTYNAEDYAIALRRWGRRALLGQQPDGNQNTLPSTCTSSSSGYVSANPGEMTLRQFTSVSELLNKLRADLRLAFPSFVQEFASAPADGISLLLETLRGVQLSQSTPPSATGSARRPRARRAALDELGCVECLAACAERCPDAARILAQAQPGLLALAVCLTSSLNRTRVLALQLLTRVCQTVGGHAAVSEAVSTLRLRYAEGGRFRFLAGALLAGKAAPALRLAGVTFLNAFIGSASSAQARLYIQAEACEAGLEPRALQAWLRELGSPEPDDDEPDQGRSLAEMLREEVRRWSRHCVDVDALQVRALRAEESCRLLSKKLTALQRQLHQLQLERRNEYNNRGPAKPGNKQESKDSTNDNVKGQRDSRSIDARPVLRAEAEKKVSSSAEDEGISFSERSSSPEEPRLPEVRQSTANQMDNDQETTIDDVIEELRIIVKDAEEELYDWNQLRDNAPKNEAPQVGPRAKAVQPSRARECLRSTEENARLDRGGLVSSGSLKIVVPGPQTPLHQPSLLTQQQQRRETNDEDDRESAIVPAIIHPQPPRRAPACLLGNSLYLASQRQPTTTCELTTLEPDVEPAMIEACVDSEPDSELLLLDDEGSDSLLSASRLNYPGAAMSHETPYRRRRSLGSAELSTRLADFETSETLLLLDDRLQQVPKRRNEAGHSNSLGSRPHPRCSNTVQRRTERRKYLRRCQSQEQIEPPNGSPGAGRGRAVLEQIRKFESLSSFELERRTSPAQLRRSESFHQTHFPVRDCEPPQRSSNDERKHQHRSMTKSLDRIDEGLDAGAAGRAHRRLCRRLSGDEHLLVSKEPRSHSQQHQQESKRRGERKYRAQREELQPGDERKYTSFLEGTRKDRPEYHRPSDPRIFANRPHDVLGFGKNRFNAGKYSGSGQPPSHPAPPVPPIFAPKTGHRHATSGQHPRAKVTDVVSGLY